MALSLWLFGSKVHLVNRLANWWWYEAPNIPMYPYLRVFTNHWNSLNLRTFCIRENLTSRCFLTSVSWYFVHDEIKKKAISGKTGQNRIFSSWNYIRKFSFSYFGSNKKCFNGIILARIAVLVETTLYWFQKVLIQT